MAKQFKTNTLLADQSGRVWVEAQLTQPQVKRLIKQYERFDITLTPYGSPDQVREQVREIERVFANDERSRPLVEAGRLQVIGVGF